MQKYRTLLIKTIQQLINRFKPRVIADGGVLTGETENYEYLESIKPALNQASLVTTPFGYAESKLFSVIPNTALGDFDVTRASNASAFNEQGKLEVPLTNRIRYSNDITNAYWTKTNLTPVLNGDWTTITDSVDGSPQPHGYSANSFTLYGSGTNNIFREVYLRNPNNLRYVTLMSSGTIVTGFNEVTFDLDTLTVTEVTEVGTLTGRGFISQDVNGVYKLSTYFRASLGSGGFRRWSLAFSDSPTPNLDGTIDYQGAGDKSCEVAFCHLSIGQTVPDFEPLPTTAIERTRFLGVTINGTTATNIPRINWWDGKPSIAIGQELTNRMLTSEPSGAEGLDIDISYESFNWDIGFANCIKFGDNSVLRFRLAGTTTIGVTYTIAAFVKMDDNSEPSINFGAATDFLLAIGGIVAPTTNIVNIPNTNIWFCQASLEAPNSSAFNGIAKLTSNSTKGFRATGLMLFEGNIQLNPWDYVQTNGAIATRLKDDIEIVTPVGVTEIKEYFSDGTDNTIVVIPPTYEMPLGDIEKIFMI